MKYTEVIQGLLAPLLIMSGAILVGVLIVANSSFAKTHEEPKSFSLKHESQENVQIVKLPDVDVERLLNEDRRDKDPIRPGPLRFAVAIAFGFVLSNNSRWQQLAEGRLWRLHIISRGAKSQNLGITHFDMPEGAKLWIYDPEHKHVEGPYTSRDRSYRGTLWTPVIEGDEIVVEVFVPVGVSSPSFEIAYVNQGYRRFATGIPGTGTEGNCEIDVVCPAGDPWRDQIRAVALYTAFGTSLCSGTLFNNPYRKPYFLSAEHCHVDNTNDHTVVVYWNYQSKNCGMHDPKYPIDTQVGGSIYRASNLDDFLLLELSAEPDPAFNVYHAGWDATGNVPPSTVGIDHPAADVKAISLSNSPPDTTDWWSSTPNPSGKYWRVLWDSGAMEDGSSGSCLFATDTKRCIGQLRGGHSSCEVGADLHDWYGRLSTSWIGGGTISTRLSDWLDPGNTGIVGINGEPHITTVNGVHYDFQGAGEFVALRDAGRLEIQTRHSPIATMSGAGPDPHDGLATCVSFNTAIAAQVGERRVTYQPDTNAVDDSSGLQLRVDGLLTQLGPKGVDLGAGGRLAQTIATDGLEIDFPDKSILFVTPGRKDGRWYFNLDLIRAPAMDGVLDTSSGSFPSPGAGGIMGIIFPGNWLPALPDGTSMGTMPASMHQRYLDLYRRFADAWRVTDNSSLFDYTPGTSTDDFTIRDWPPEKPPCVIPKAIPVQPVRQAVAQDACELVTAKNMHADCVFDVMVTGDTGFAKTYLLSQRIRDGSTATRLSDSKNLSNFEEAVTFTATVVRTAWTDKRVPTGTVQFMLDDQDVGDVIQLDPKGQATWTTFTLQPGKHVVSATYIPSKGSAFLSSTSIESIHSVSGQSR